MSNRRKVRQSKSRPDLQPFALVGALHRALHEPALPVRMDMDAGDLILIARRMALTCQKAHGVAIAAPQVGISLRLLIVEDQAWVNPTIESLTGQETGLEGCLSLPGRVYRVPRATTAKIALTPLQGSRVSLDVEGFAARVWQHEIDHLDGIMISERGEETVQPLVGTSIL